MSTPSATHARVLRVTLELKSPLALGSGHSAGLFDSPCALDANGLPCLPGSSLAGALRAWWSQHLEATHPTETWFGFVPFGDDAVAARRSMLGFSFGHIHDCNNMPVDAPRAQAALQQDDILKGLLGAALPHREHVRLTQRGTAADSAKFDRSFVPAGHRFSFQISLRAHAAALVQQWEPARNALLRALLQGDIVLGGASRVGYGRVLCVAAHEVEINLSKPDDRARLPRLQHLDIALPNTARSLLTLLDKPSPLPAGQADALTLNLALKATDLWRVGSTGVQGNPFGADAEPYSENFIQWDGINPGSVQSRKVVPGSGIKGALAHRATFHANRLTQRWADAAEGNAKPLADLSSLFGSVNGADGAHAGAVWVDDALLESVPRPSNIHLPHVRLDRFTGGAWSGALFDEALLHGGALVLTLRIDPRRLAKNALGVEFSALAEALHDLGTGQLSLGAGSARGLGRFKFSDPAQAQRQLQALRHAQPEPEHTHV